MTKTNGIISRVRHYATTKVLKSIYHAFFESNLSYGIQVWGQGVSLNSRIGRLQKIAVRLISFSNWNDHTEPLFKQLDFLTFPQQVFTKNVTLVYKIMNDLTPESVSNALRLTRVINPYQTRSALLGRTMSLTLFLFRTLHLQKEKQGL